MRSLCLSVLVRRPIKRSVYHAYDDMLHSSFSECTKERQAYISELSVYSDVVLKIHDLSYIILLTPGWGRGVLLTYSKIIQGCTAQMGCFFTRTP